MSPNFDRLPMSRKGHAPFQQSSDGAGAGLGTQFSKGRDSRKRGVPLPASHRATKDFRRGWLWQDQHGKRNADLPEPETSTGEEAP